MMASPKDGVEHRIQRAYASLDMGALYSSLAPLPLSVSDNAQGEGVRTGAEDPG
jgi:hypothetical protein